MEDMGFTVLLNFLYICHSITTPITREPISLLVDFSPVSSDLSFDDFGYFLFPFYVSLYPTDKGVLSVFIIYCGGSETYIHLDELNLKT